MKKLFTVCLILFVFIRCAEAQIYNTPLTMHGLNQTVGVSAISGSMGGITIALKNDPSLLFANPSSLLTLEGFQLSIGGILQYQNIDHKQQWFPLLYYSNFSLLMQGLTRDIPDPDTIRNFPPTAGDSVQRPFDNIEPNWKYYNSKRLPVQASIGVPFEIGGIKFAGGIGVVQYANMNYRCQNNNVLSPDFGSFRSGVFTLPPTNRLDDSKLFYWYQIIRQRVGHIYGYGGALSAALNENIAFGLSAMLLDGKTDDYESIVSRGELRFFRDYFGLYKFQQDTIRSGTSDFSGYEYTLNGTYRGQIFDFGIAVKPPATIKRDYKGTLRIDTIGTLMNSRQVSNTDEIILPWRSTMGLSVALRKNIKIGFELDYTPYSSAVIFNSDGKWSKPWLDCISFRFGLEYLIVPELAIRGGYFTQQEVFEPEGNYNPGEPISSSGYSTGFGCNIINNILFSFSYGYLKIRYEDKWATNVNMNTDVRESFIFNVAYIIPW